jgi:hypothetical protein
MGEITKKNLSNEIKVLKKLQHRNIVELIEVVETKNFIALV